MLHRDKGSQCFDAAQSGSEQGVLSMPHGRRQQEHWSLCGRCTAAASRNATRPKATLGACSEDRGVQGGEQDRLGAGSHSGCFLRDPQSSDAVERAVDCALQTVYVCPRQRRHMLV